MDEDIKKELDSTRKSIHTDEDIKKELDSIRKSIHIGEDLKDELTDIKKLVSENNKLLVKERRGRLFKRSFYIILVALMVIVSYYSYVVYFLPIQEQLITGTQRAVSIFDDLMRTLDASKGLLDILNR